MRNFKLDDLYLLQNGEEIYPRIFLNKEDAENTNKVLGNEYIIKPVFINN